MVSTCRTSLPLVLVAGVLLLGAAVPGPAAAAGVAPAAPTAAAARPAAAADDVADAERQVAALRARVEAVAVELTAGVQQYEAGEQALAAATTEATAADRASRAAQDLSGDSRAALQRVVVARYVNPRPVGLQLLLSPTMRSAYDLLGDQAVLARLQEDAGSVQDRARADSSGARDARVRAQVAADDLVRLSTEHEQALAALQALTVTTNDELQAADQRLRDARAEQAVRRAREQALAADRRAREQALADRRVREQALAADARTREAGLAADARTREAGLAADARTREAGLAADRQAGKQALAADARTGEESPAAGQAAPPSGAAPAAGAGAGSCGTATDAGAANGFLDPAALCPLYGAPGHRLRGDAAAAFNAMSRAREAETGSPLCATDSYRNYAQQVQVFKDKPSLAAVPGTSNHGWGIAVDFCGGIQSFGTEAHTWMTRHAGEYGWVHPSWAEPGGNRPEPWHWEFGG